MHKHIVLEVIAAAQAILTHKAAHRAIMACDAERLLMLGQVCNLQFNLKGELAIRASIVDRMTTKSPVA